MFTNAKIDFLRNFAKQLTANYWHSADNYLFLTKSIGMMLKRKTRSHELLKNIPMLIMFEHGDILERCIYILHT